MGQSSGIMCVYAYTPTVGKVLCILGKKILTSYKEREAGAGVDT